MRVVQTLVAGAAMACSLMTLTARSAGAWGNEGHHVIALVAYHRLTPTTKAAVDDLLGTIPVAEAATFADNPYRFQVPTSYNWHFVDIPRSADKYKASRDCQLDPQKGDCVINELDRLKATLSDASKPKADRQLALKLLIHFVGDLHQPLHCADDNDRGGNEKKVCFFTSCSVHGKPRELHAAWDSYMIERAQPDETSYVALLEANIAGWSSEKMASVQNGDWIAWADQTHRIAVDHAYGDLPSPQGGVYQLAATYDDTEVPIVDDQLATAAVRLAMVLEELFAGGSPAPSDGTEEVFINHNGHAYHRADCRYTGPSSQKVSLDAAKQMHRTPCGVCKPTS